MFNIPFQRMIELLREALLSLRRQAVFFESKFGRTLVYPKRDVRCTTVESWNFSNTLSIEPTTKSPCHSTTSPRAPNDHKDSEITSSGHLLPPGKPATRKSPLSHHQYLSYYSLSPNGSGFPICPVSHILHELTDIRKSIFSLSTLTYTLNLLMPSVLPCFPSHNFI